jgi:hypothetical protein
MAKFRVMIVKKNGKPVGVRAAQINGRIIYLALRDELEPMNWYDAVKVGIPSKEEMLAIAENFDAISRAFVRAGKKPLRKGWYWSSSEESSNYAWSAGLNYSYLTILSKYTSGSYVLPVLAL